MAKVRRFCGYTWQEMNCVLDFICAVENEIELNEQDQKDFNVVIQCVTEIMNRMKDGKGIIWDDEKEPGV